MNQSKPIFIIRFPYDSISQGDDRNRLDGYQDSITKQLHDYHVLFLIENNIDKIAFEYYNSNVSEIEFEELKNKIDKTLNEIINQSKNKK